MIGSEIEMFMLTENKVKINNPSCYQLERGTVDEHKIFKVKSVMHCCKLSESKV